MSEILNEVAKMNPNDYFWIMVALLTVAMFVVGLVHLFKSGFNIVTIGLAITIVSSPFLMQVEFGFGAIFLVLVFCGVALMGTAHSLDLLTYKIGWQKKPEPKKSMLVVEPVRTK